MLFVFNSVKLHLTAIIIVIIIIIIIIIIVIIVIITSFIVKAAFHFTSSYNHFYFQLLF